MSKMKQSSQAKDEFEHMVNWKRVFEQIWQQIRWLISYGQIKAGNAFVELSLSN